MRNRMFDQLRAEIPNLDPKGMAAKICNALDAQLDAFEMDISKHVWETLTSTTKVPYNPNTGFFGSLTTGTHTMSLDPAQILATFRDPATSLPCRGVTVQMSDGTYFEEIKVNELMPDDVITHVQDGKIWREVTKLNGDPSKGFLVSRDDTRDLFGYILEADGAQSAVESYLFGLDYPHKVRVISYEQLVKTLKNPAATLAPKAPSKEWNGKCPQCGQIAYLGLFSVDHKNTATKCPAQK